MKDVVNYADRLPYQPESKIKLNWFLKKKFDENFIIYKVDASNHKMVACHCTSCESDFTMDRVKSDSYCSNEGIVWYNDVFADTVYNDYITHCPCCGDAVKAYHITHLSRYGMCIGTVYCTEVEEIDGHIALIQYRATRKLYQSGKDDIEVNAWEACVVSGKKITRYAAHRRYVYADRLEKWGIRNTFRDCIGLVPAFNILTDIDDIKKIVEKSDNCNCKLDEYIKNGKEFMPASYMRLYLKHNNVENIIMQGGSDIITDLIYTIPNYNNNYTISNINIKEINWKEVKPSKMFGLTKDEWKYCIENKWLHKDIEFYLKAKDRIKLDEVKICENYTYYNAERLLNLADKINIMKTFRYIDNYGYASIVDVNYWIDYYNMLKMLEIDINNESLYPKDLVSRHDGLMLQVQLEGDKLTDRMFKKRYAELKKYCFAENGIEIHPAKSSAEMRKEGTKLHHCVATYIKKHARAETTIFFIRKSEKPKEPFYTLEFDFKSNRVVQNRGNRNCERTKEIQEFENKWVKFVKNARERIVENGKSSCCRKAS